MTTPPLEEVTEEVLLRAVEDTIGHGVVRPGTLDGGIGPRTAQEARSSARTMPSRRSPAASSPGCPRTGSSTTDPGASSSSADRPASARPRPRCILSKILGGGREAMLRVDCNTLQGSGNEDAAPLTNRLLGVPPGYIGYARGEGGMLSKIRDTPECDRALRRDREGQSVDSGSCCSRSSMRAARRTRTAISSTSAERSSCSRPTPAPSTTRRARSGSSVTSRRTEPVRLLRPCLRLAVKDDLLRRGYGEEFFGRQIDFIVFEAMERGDVEIVLKRQLERLKDTAELRGYDLTWEPAVFSHLLSEWTPRFGGALGLQHPAQSHRRAARPGRRAGRARRSPGHARRGRPARRRRPARRPRASRDRRASRGEADPHRPGPGLGAEGGRTADRRTRGPARSRATHLTVFVY